MLREEIQRALLRDLVVRLAVAATFIAAKPVARAGVDIALNFRLHRADRVDIGQRDWGARLPKMHLYRAVWLLLLGPREAAAVPAGRRRERMAARRTPPGHRTAKAITDNAEPFARQMSGRR